MTLGVFLLFPSFHGVRGPVNAEMLLTYNSPILYTCMILFFLKIWGWRTIILSVQPYEHNFEGYS